MSDPKEPAAPPPGGADAANQGDKPREGLASFLPDAQETVATPLDEANRLRWNRKGTGRYEVWYITAIDRETGAGFWFRYTVHASKSGRPTCAVWASVFDPNDDRTPRGLKASHPIGAFDAQDRPFRVSVGEHAWFDGRRARGAVGEGADRIEWDLQLSGSDRVHRHFSEGLYRWGIAKSCVNSPNVNVRADGHVKHGDREYVLRGAPADQSHVFGKKHAVQWAWAHCNAFPKDETAVLEVVRAKSKAFGIGLPEAAFILLRTGGEEYLVDGFWKAMGVKGTTEVGRLEVEARVGDVIVRAEIAALPERTLALPYEDPDGTELWCHSSIIADATVEVLTREGGGGFHPRVRLESMGTTALEVGQRERDPRIERELERL